MSDKKTREIMRSVRDSNINYAVETAKKDRDDEIRRGIAAAKRSVLVAEAGEGEK